MSIKTVWAAFFSATDTTKQVVTRIAARLAEQTGAALSVYDFTLPADRKDPKTFTAGDLVVFGTPVYAGWVPNLLIKFVAAVRGGGALAVRGLRRRRGKEARQGGPDPRHREGQ